MHKPLPTIDRPLPTLAVAICSRLMALLLSLVFALVFAMPAAALQSKSAANLAPQTQHDFAAAPQNTPPSKSANTVANKAAAYPYPVAKAGGAKETLGWLQSIRLLPHKVRMTAKLDTGAKSSVIHAVDIKPFSKNASRWVRFTVPVKKKKGLVEMKFELPVFSRSRIKQHHSEELDKRYVVMLDFCIAGQVYSAQFSLDDRDKFNYPMLLGRDFLQDYFVVDPSQTFVQKYNCLPQSKGKK